MNKTIIEELVEKEIKRLKTEIQEHENEIYISLSEARINEYKQFIENNNKRLTELGCEFINIQLLKNPNNQIWQWNLDMQQAPHNKYQGIKNFFNKELKPKFYVSLVNANNDVIFSIFPPFEEFQDAKNEKEDLNKRRLKNHSSKWVIIAINLTFEVIE